MLFVNLFTTDTESLLAPKASEDMQCNIEPENDPAPVPKHREISTQAVPCTCDVNTQFSTQSYSEIMALVQVKLLYSCIPVGTHRTCPS